MLFELAAGEQSVMLGNGCYALAALLALLIMRIWYYYKFQMRAMEAAAPLIRKAICAHLYAGREFRLPFHYDFKTELQMILDLSKWRFRDFFPGLTDE
jgi:hypothetical protein